MAARTLPANPDRSDVTRQEQLSASSAAAVPLPLASAPQTVLEVTTTADIIDATDGLLSLREAVVAANATPGLDTITFSNTVLFAPGPVDIQSTIEITDDRQIFGSSDDTAPQLTIIENATFSGGIFFRLYSS